MLANVPQAMIKPVIAATVAKGSLIDIDTDEYNIYARLPAWGDRHKTVCHGRGEYARDEDGDGFCKVHVNTMEGLWSVLRSWLRPHRAFRRRSCRTISASFHSCTMRVAAAKHCSARSLPLWSPDPAHHPEIR
jgi:ISXO2-like transposase domain